MNRFAPLLLLLLPLAPIGCGDPAGGPETPPAAGTAEVTATAPAASQPANRRAGARRRPDRFDPDLQPSVVFFTVDTLRADRLGVYGYDRYPTSPMLNAFAQQAVVFEQAYAPSPWTLPTMVSVMTSTFPCEHGTLTSRDALSASVTPMAQRLKKAGYTTLKLYANDFVGKANGLDRGYDALLASARNGGKKVARFLNEHGNTPFFLYIHNTEPHNPYHFAPERIPGFPEIGQETRDRIGELYKAYRKATRADFVAEQALGTADTSAAQTELMEALNQHGQAYTDLYDASVRYSDLLFGSVVRTLKNSGGLNKVVIVFISDHGEEFFEHGGWTHDQSVYEELLRVPLMIRFPNGAHGGQRIRTPVSLVDLMPTLGSYLNVPSLSDDVRGRDLMPLIRGEADAEDQARVVGMRDNRMKYYRPWAEGRGDVNVAVRVGSFKGIWNADPDTVEIYDLAADPGETHDLAATRPDLVGQVRDTARDWYESCAAGQLTPSASDKMQDLDNLRTLGYVD